MGRLKRFLKFAVRAPVFWFGLGALCGMIREDLRWPVGSVLWAVGVGVAAFVSARRKG